MKEFLAEDLIGIEENLKIIDIFPTSQAFYVYGSHENHHDKCFGMLADKCFANNETVSLYMKDNRVESFEDYLVKSNHIVLLNLSPLGSTSSLVVFYQDTITQEQSDILFDILEKSDFEDVRICIHNADNRYGPYHYEEYYETPKTLKKEKYLVV